MVTLSSSLFAPCSLRFAPCPLRFALRPLPIAPSLRKLIYIFGQTSSNLNASERVNPKAPPQASDLKYSFKAV
jgi:hypothetical protein